MKRLPDRPDPRAGFTMVEFLVAAVIASFVLTATYQVLVTQQRIASVQNEQVRAQQTVRAGLDILSQELREVSAVGSDLIAADPTSVTVRVMRSFGLACAITSSVPPVLTASVPGRAFQSGDSVYVFVDGDPGTPADDRWRPSTVSAVVSGVTCPGGRVAQLLTLSGFASLAQVDSLRSGAMIRAFELRRYGVSQVDGEFYLARTEGDAAVALVGPLAGATGIQFAYLDALGVPTATPGLVRQIRATVLTRSAIRDQAGQQVADSVATVVYLRN